MGIFDGYQELREEIMRNEPVRLDSLADEVFRKMELDCAAEEMLNSLGMYEDGNLRARVRTDSFYLG